MKRALFLLLFLIVAIVPGRAQLQPLQTTDTPNSGRTKLNANDQLLLDSIAVHRAVLLGAGTDLVKVGATLALNDTITQIMTFSDTVKVGTVAASINQGSRTGGTDFAHNEVRPRLWIEKGLGIFPEQGGLGYSNLNFYSGQSPRGGGLINWFHENPSDKYIAQAFIGYDFVQTLATADSLPPLFILFGLYDTNNVANDYNGIVMENYTQPGVGNRYRGDMGFGAPLSIVGRKFSFQMPIVDPSSQTIFNLHRSSTDSTHTWMEFTHGSSGLTFFDINWTGRFRWFHPTSGSHSPYSGSGWAIDYLDAANNRPHLAGGLFQFQAQESGDAGPSYLTIGGDAVSAGGTANGTVPFYASDFYSGTTRFLRNTSTILIDSLFVQKTLLLRPYLSPIDSVKVNGTAFEIYSGGNVFSTEDGPAGSGITSLGGLTAGTQTFATGTAGTDFAISSLTSTHTFNIPSSSASNRGLLTSADWTTFNNKLATNGDGSALTGLLFSQIGSTPTTLPGYGITDALSNLASSTQNGAFGNISLFDDTTPSHYLTFTAAENLTAARTLSIVTGDASRTLTFAGDATISGVNTGDQTITLTGDVIGTGTGSFATTIAAGAVDIAMHSATGTPDGTTFLRGDNVWATPAGSGDMVLASAQTNTGAKTFLDNTLLMRNVANTFSSDFTNTNTAARSYTLPDKDMTVAGLDDLFTNTASNGEMLYQLDANTIDGVAGVTTTEVGYLAGVTSALQTQLGTKAPLASPTFTGTVTIPTPFTLGAVSVTPTGTELNFIDGVTSAIQTQIDGKQATISFGTGVQTALGVNVGSAGAFITFNGAGGTPSSLTGTNITGIPGAGIVSGSVTVTQVEAELKTGTQTFTVLDTVKTTGERVFSWKVPHAITITEVAAFTDANTVTFQLEERAEATPNTTGTTVMTASLVADTDQQETTSFTNAAQAANTWLTAVVSTAGDVTYFSVTIRYTID